MTDPTKPPGGLPLPLAENVFDPNVFLQFNEFTDKLKQIREQAEQTSLVITKEFQEKLAGGIKDAREKSGVEFQTFSQYITDLKREYSSLASVAELQIKEMIASNEGLKESNKKNLEIISESFVKLKETINQLLPANQELFKTFSETQNIDNFQNSIVSVSNRIKALSQELKTNEESLKTNNDKIGEQKKIFGANADRAEQYAKEMLNLQNTQKLLTKGSEEYYLVSGEIENLQREMNDLFTSTERPRILALVELFKKETSLQEKKIENEKQLKQLEEAKKAIDPTIEVVAKFKQAEIQQKLNDLKLKEATAMEPLIRMDRMRTEGLENLNKQFGKYADALLPGSNASNTFASAMLAVAFSTEKSGNALDNLTKSIRTGIKDAFLDPQKAMNSFANFMYDNVIKSTFEFDKQLAQVNKETGGFRKEFEQVAMNKGTLFSSTDIGNLSMYGMKLSDVAKVYKDLATNILGFNNLASSQRKILLENSAELTTLGLSSTTYGSLVGKFMASASKSAAEASDMMNKVAKDAVGLGQDVQKYAEGLSNAIGKVSGYAREATEIYRQLSAVSQATKGVITTADLTALSEGFSTFDKAAESVSKLNAMLGGTSLSIVDMMQKDPAEQIMAIKRAAGDASLDFDKLNIGYKRLLAEYFGGDINKAAAFFKMNMEEANKLINEGSASEKELAERREQSAAAQEKLAATLERIKLSLTPITKIIDFALTGMNKFIDTFGALPTVIGIATFAFIRVRRAVSSIKAEAVAAGKKFTDAFEQSNKNIQEMIASLKVLVTQLQKGTDEANKLEQELKQAAAAKKELESGGGGGGGGAPKGRFGKALSAIGGFLSNEKVLMAMTGVSMAAGMMSNLSEPSPVEGKDFIMTADPKSGEVRKLADFAPTDKLKIEASQSTDFINKSSNQFQYSYNSSNAPSYISQTTSSGVFNGGDNVTNNASAVNAAKEFYEQNSIVSEKQLQSNERLREATEKNTTSVIANNNSSSEINQTNEKLLSSTYERNREMREGSTAVYEQTTTAMANAAGQAAVAAMSSTTNNIGGNIANSSTTNNYTGGAVPNIMVSFDEQLIGRLAARLAPKMADESQSLV